MRGEKGPARLLKTVATIERNGFVGGDVIGPAPLAQQSAEQTLSAGARGVDEVIPVFQFDQSGFVNHRLTMEAIEEALTCLSSSSQRFLENGWLWVPC